MKPVVILFDLDGVLVRPGGYRAAVQATVNYFARWLGLPERAPDEATIAIFEAQGITSEWDMIPLTLAVLIESAAGQLERAGDLSSLTALRSQNGLGAVADLTVDYAPSIRRMGAYLRAGEAPADSFLAACQAGQIGDLFPHLSGQGILPELFAHTRQLALSPTTRIFEHFVLGSRAFQDALGLPAEFESSSYLATLDQPLLVPTVRDQLLDLRRQNRLSMAAYTARPSAWTGSRQVGEPLPAIYAPEAEMALDLVGLESIPLVGYGQMGGLGLALGLNEDALIKPAPFHSMTAIAAAWTGDRSAALDWAQAVFASRHMGAARPGRGTAAGSLPEALDLHIFEDSAIGLVGGKQAVELLHEQGIAANLHLWGISAHPDKAAALQAVGASVFADVNQAVVCALAG